MSSPSSRRSPSPKPRPNRLAHTFEEKHETIEHPPRGCVAAAVYRRSLRPDINHRHRHGDNYQTFGPYPAPPPAPTINDNYWINIATYPPVATPAPAWVTTPHSLWAPPQAGSLWIGPRNQNTSDPAVTAANPGYSIFRKCFCLAPDFREPRLSFNVRADDFLQVWLNTVTNVLVAPQAGNMSSTAPLISVQSNNPAQFRAGRNCLYVLVEDQLAATGFNLK